MKFLSINQSPYTIDFAIFDYESKKLLQYGTSYYHEKDTTKRIMEIWVNIEELLDDIKPNIVLTQLLDLRYTLKRDLENIVQIRTILRKLCFDKNILYNEFRTLGWEKRITNMKKPSKKAKLKIVREYSKLIDREEICDAIILGESVVWNRVQIGKE
jgi:hypothetical protein